MNDDIARALTAVLIPAPGNRTRIPDIHRAVSDHLDRGGIRYSTLKSILRAAGVQVRALEPNGEAYVFGCGLRTAPNRPR